MFSANYDFDDILRRFEAKFGTGEENSNDAEVHHPDQASESSADSVNGKSRSFKSTGEELEESAKRAGAPIRKGTKKKSSPVYAAEFEDELSCFFSEFCRGIHANGKLDSSCTFDQQRSSLVTSGSQDVVRAVLKKELQSFINRMTDIDFFFPEQGTGAAANRSAVTSLKRQLQEKRIELEWLQRTSKENEVECRNLREKVQQLKVDKDDAISETLKQSHQIDRLHERVKSLKHHVEQRSKDYEHVSVQKERLERHVQALRKNLVESQNDTENMKLERDVIERKYQNISRRNKDAKKSESLLVEKVEELQAIQRQMIEQMEEIQGGNNGARGAFNALNARRSKLVGRIATMLTKKDRSGVRGNLDTSSSDNSPNRTADDGSGQMGQKTVTGVFATGESANTGPGKATPNTGSSSAAPDRVVEPPRKNGLARKLTFFRPNLASSKRNADEGNEGDVMNERNHSHLLNENNRQALTSRAKKALFNDLSTMRNLIAQKEEELDAMRSEVDAANDKAAQLELDLLKAEQTRKRESRNVGGRDVVTARESLQQQRNMRSPLNTKFKWQEAPVAGTTDTQKVGELAIDSPVSNRSDV